MIGVEPKEHDPGISVKRAALTRPITGVGAGGGNAAGSGGEGAKSAARIAEIEAVAPL